MSRTNLTRRRAQIEQIFCIYFTVTPHSGDKKWSMTSYKCRNVDSDQIFLAGTFQATLDEEGTLLDHYRSRANIICKFRRHYIYI